MKHIFIKVNKLLLKISKIDSINISKTRKSKPDKQAKNKPFQKISYAGNDFNKYLINFGSLKENTLYQKDSFVENAIDTAEKICKEKGTEAFFELIKKNNFNFCNPRLIFNGLLENKETAYHLIKAMTLDFIKMPERIKIIEEKLGQPIYLLENYQDGFEHFQKRFIEESSIEELLKYRPDWSPEVLRKKLHGLGKMTLGSYDDLFESQKEFDDFMLKLNLGQGKPLKEDENEYTKTFELNGKTYKYKEYKEGFSNKSVYEVTNGNDTFIVKVDDYANTQEDSTFQNACFDYYLNQNGCQNTPKLYYYKGNGTALYEKIEGRKIYSSFIQEMETINYYLKPYDVKNTDMQGKNNIIIDPLETYKIIDMGHSYFESFYKPKVLDINEKA